MALRSAQFICDRNPALLCCCCASRKVVVRCCVCALQARLSFPRYQCCSSGLSRLSIVIVRVGGCVRRTVLPKATLLFIQILLICDSFIRARNCVCWYPDCFFVFGSVATPPPLSFAYIGSPFMTPLLLRDELFLLDVATLHGLYPLSYSISGGEGVRGCSRRPRHKHQQSERFTIQCRSCRTPEYVTLFITPLTVIMCFKPRFLSSRSQNLHGGICICFKLEFV